MAARRGGILHVVATPIGNLSDVTLRALEVLRASDAVFAEDTRRTRRLLARHGLRSPLVSAHAHNERGRVAELLRRLGSGESVVLVTDAGSPGVADPGAALVAAAAEAGFAVVTVPGPSAVVAALAVSGFPADAFSFAGFLPARGPARERRLRALLERPETLVFFEAPHRVRETLDALAALAPERPIAACRELTKTFEEVLRGRPADVRSRLTDERERGEWTIVVGPAKASRAKMPADSRRASGGAEALAGELERSGLERAEAERRAEFIYGGGGGSGARNRKRDKHGRGGKHRERDR